MRSPHSRVPREPRLGSSRSLSRPALAAGACAFIVLVTTLLPYSSHHAAAPAAFALQANRSNAAPAAPRALAPVELLVRAAARPYGVAASPEGRIFFSDEAADTVSEILSGGSVRIVSDRLHRPRGLMWEGPGQLVALAQRVLRPLATSPVERSARGVLVRIEVETGALTVLADGLRQ